MVSTALEPPRAEREPFRFTRQDYDAMIAAGILDENDRVELIAGEILTKMPIGPSHASIVKRLNRLFSASAGERCVISVQDPIALDEFSEPEPDLALLISRADLYSSSHPTAADVLLIVEVSDTTPRFDRECKVPLYAAAGVPEVWLIDLVEKTLTRYRQPAGGSYRDVTRHLPAETIPVPGLPRAHLRLADLGL